MLGSKCSKILNLKLNIDFPKRGMQYWIKKKWDLHNQNLGKLGSEPRKIVEYTPLAGSSSARLAVGHSWVSATNWVLVNRPMSDLQTFYFYFVSVFVRILFWMRRIGRYNCGAWDLLLLLLLPWPVSLLRMLRPSAAPAAAAPGIPSCSFLLSWK